MRYFILAGEASGDLHGSRLMRSLRSRDPQAEFCFWGGDLMAAESKGLKKHIRDLAFMGFWEVIRNIRTIRRFFRECKAEIDSFRPDAIILIDYPGFNLRMAKWAHGRDYRVFYYISPQVWAWKSGRVHDIERYVERMFVILPFEEAFYRSFGVEVEYVGHPLIDVVENFSEDPHFREKYNQKGRPVIAIVPGSRQQEIRRLLPEMLQAVSDLDGYSIGIACAPAVPASVYEEILANEEDLSPDIFLVENQTYDLLRISEAAVVTSGTATLETALFDVPQVVCYKGSGISYRIARRLVKVPFIALVNLIAGERVVEELIQRDCNPPRIRAELDRLLQPAVRMEMEKKYAAIRDKLYVKGAADAVANQVISSITSL